MFNATEVTASREPKDTSSGRAWSGLQLFFLICGLKSVFAILSISCIFEPDHRVSADGQKLDESRSRGFRILTSPPHFFTYGALGGPFINELLIISPLNYLFSSSTEAKFIPPGHVAVIHPKHAFPKTRAKRRFRD